VSPCRTRRGASSSSGQRPAPEDWSGCPTNRRHNYSPPCPELKLQDLWIKDIAIATGLVSATTTPILLKLVAQGKLTPEKFVSHRFTFENIMDAYDTFGRAAETKALKVVITR